MSDTKTVVATAPCSLCRRQMFAASLDEVDGKKVCNPNNRAACNRIAAERKPRARVSE